MKWTRSASTLALAGSLFTPSLRADEPTAMTAAQALFEQAREDMRRGDFAAALPKLEDSERLDPAIGTLLNLVLCEEKFGRLARAWLHARELVDRLPAGDERAAIARQRVEILSRRAPKATVRLEAGAPSDTKVLLDGVELPRSSLDLPIVIDLGPHRVVAVAPDGRTGPPLDFEAAEGGQYVRFAIAPSSSVATQALVPPAPLRAAITLAPVSARPPHDQPPEGRGVPRWVGWTAAGIGAASLAAAGAFGILTLDRRSTVESVCPDKTCRDPSGLQAADQGKVFFAATLVSGALAAIGGGVGAYVLLRGDAAAQGVSGAGLSFRGAF
jgi:hypothetical protein